MIEVFRALQSVSSLLDPCVFLMQDRDVVQICPVPADWRVLKIGCAFDSAIIIGTAAVDTADCWFPVEQVILPTAAAVA